MDFTEQETLNYILKYYIEDNTDIKVNQSLSLGASSIVLNAIRGGDIDLYVDYTGTIYGSVLGKEPNSNVKEVYDTVKKEMKSKYDLNVLKSFAFNNTYTLAVKKETAEKYNLNTISDLAKVSDELVFSPTLTFVERKDCLVGLKKAYPINFKEIVPIDGSPRYAALMNGESDVIDAYSTDGLIKKFNLKILKDDKQFFLPYNAIPVTNDRVKEDFPEVEKLLDKLGKYLNEETMIDLNYRVDELKQKPSDVARDFLIEKNLIKNK